MMCLSEKHFAQHHKPFLYKDASPKETIEKIESIFKTLGFSICEEKHETAGMLIHSIRININGSTFGANGKGMSIPATLASAYAELIERYQNQFFKYPLIMNCDKKLDHHGFIYSPDEKIFSVTDYIAYAGKTLLWYFAPIDATYAEPEKWLKHFSNKGRLHCVPFFDIINRKNLFLPIFLIRYAYGSTGSCAGNTPYEAMVQGMSEIIERHAMRLIYHEAITPPEINRNVLSVSPVLLAMIHEIEENSDFRVSIKDCSLGHKLPAVAIVLHNIRKGTYHTCFGAHPNIDEAISRCLTEAFQGRNIKHYTGDVNVNLFDPPDTNEPDSLNFRNLIKTGKGSYPNSFFFGDNSYPQYLSLKPEKMTNPEAFHYLKKLLYHYSDTPIFVRNHSYLGFPAFYIIIPGMANEQYCFSNIESRLLVNQCTPLIMNLDRRSKDEMIHLKTIIKKMVHSNIVEDSKMYDITWLPFASDSQWAKTDLHLFLFFLNVHIGHIDDALAEIEMFIEKVRSIFPDDSNDSVPLFSAMRDYIVLKEKECLTDNSIDHVLKQLYQEQIAENVINFMSDSEKPFSDLKIPRCFQCDECECEPECDFSLWQQLHGALREKMAVGKMQNVYDLF